MNWQLDDEEFASERLETVFTVRRSLVYRVWSPVSELRPSGLGHM